MRIQSTLVAVIVVSGFTGASIAQPITRVGVSSKGQQPDAESSSLSVSADGRFVAFESLADNLVSADTNGVADVFVFDRETGQTIRVSVDSTGRELGAGASCYRSCLSGDGRFVAFVTVDGEIRPGVSRDGAFVHDMLTGETTRVSVNSLGDQENGGCWSATMSSDGRMVAFVSGATNLAPGDTNGSTDVFLHDLQTGQTFRGNVTLLGRQSLGEGNINEEPQLSADGRFVTFRSTAVDLTPDGRGGLFVHDTLSGETSLVSVDSLGNSGDGGNGSPAISGDGRFVAFQSWSTNLVPDDTNGCAPQVCSDVFVRDRESGRTTRVSVDSQGGQANRRSEKPSISSDGRYVAFASGATNLVSGPTTGWHIFVHDHVSGETRLIDEQLSGAEGASAFPVISSNASFVAFESGYYDLVDNDTNGKWDAFVRGPFVVQPRSVIPSSGSENGEDVVNVSGDLVSAGGATTVRFGEVAGVVLDVTRDRILVRTPPGVGTVAVTVSNATGSGTLANAYTYLDPALAVRYGSVGVGRGDRENVLLVNAVSGDPVTREIKLGRREAIQAVVLSPSGRRSSRYAVFGWRGSPVRDTLAALPAGIGRIGFAPPFLGGSPLVIWNTIGHPGSLGAPTFPSVPAPAVLIRGVTGAVASTVTLQGIIEDDASPSGIGISVTNAIVLRIR